MVDCKNPLAAFKKIVGLSKQWNSIQIQCRSTFQHVRFQTAPGEKSFTADVHWHSACSRCGQAGSQRHFLKRDALVKTANLKCTGHSSFIVLQSLRGAAGDTHLGSPTLKLGPRARHWQRKFKEEQETKKPS